jgi:iron complex outermembrane receptor protein
MTNRHTATALAILTIAGCLSAAENPQTNPQLDKLLGTPISAATESEHVLSSTAAKYEQELGSVPASITIITAEEIARYGWTTLDQVLQSVPGFYLTNDRNFTYLGVRGIGRPTDYNSRILVMLDGHDLNEPVLGQAPGGSDLAIDLQSVEKIEIVRGPGSAVYGSHAMHAVINVITKTADDMDGLSASARLGSHADQAASLRFGKTLANGAQVTASALWQESNGANLFFPEYDAVARGRDYENLYGVALGLTKGNFKLSAVRRSRTKGIPTGSYESLFNVDSRTTNWGDLVAAQYAHAIGANKILELSASWDRTGEHGVWPYDPSADIDNTFGVRLTGEARLHWDLEPNHRLTAGVEVSDVRRARYDFGTVGEPLTHFSVPYRVVSPYVEYDFRPTQRLGIVVGVRHDDFSATADSTNPRLAVLFTPSKSATLKILYGTAFRSPNTYETLYSDPLTQWKANPNLKPERIRSTELEWEERLSPELFFVASAYHNMVTGMIDQQVDPSDGSNHYQNLNRISSNGVELRLDRKSARSWAYLSYSFVDADGATGNLDNSPRQMIKAGLSTSPWQPIHFGLDAVYEKPRFTRDGQRSDSFLLLNGTMSKQLGQHVRLGVTARNLLNVLYATPVGPELRQQSIRQDGRTLALQVTLTP